MANPELEYKHRHTCGCPDCRRVKALRASLINDGAVCVSSTRCKCPDCTATRKAYTKAYGQKNKEGLREKAKKRNEGRKDEIAAYQKKYYQDNKEYLDNHKRLYTEANYERIREQRYQFRENNRARLNETQKEYYENNRESRLEYAKMFRDEMMHPEYKIWDTMVQRCFNENNSSYHNYGGRGITMHLPWKDSFENFITDMGERPEPREKYSIDRIDNDGDYEPTNCRWATWVEQSANTRRATQSRLDVPENSTIAHLNRDMTIVEFAQTTGLHLQVVKYRYSFNPKVEWILNPTMSNRTHEWEGQFYNLSELAIIRGISLTDFLRRMREEKITPLQIMEENNKV